VLTDVRGAATFRLTGEAPGVDTPLALLVRSVEFWIDRPLGGATLIAAVLIVYVIQRRRRAWSR
jgi:hypothetical protein